MDSEEMDDFCDWISGGNLDPNYEYRSKSKSLDTDTRINKPKTLDINDRYKELQEYTNSDMYRNTIRAKQLLSRDYEIDNENLKHEMQRNYSLTNLEYNQVLENLANDRETSVRMSLFDHRIKLKKR